MDNRYNEIYVFDENLNEHQELENPQQNFNWLQQLERQPRDKRNEASEKLQTELHEIYQEVQAQQHMKNLGQKERAYELMRLAKKKEMP